MKRNDFYTYLTVSLAMLIPFPGRLAYGILMIILLNLLMLFGTLVGKFSTALQVEELHPVIVSIALMSISILYRQILVLFSPVLALTLGFLVYIPAFSSFMIGSMYTISNEKLTEDLKQNMKQSGLFSFSAILFFLFRDIFGYGTITLPSADGLLVIELFNANNSLLMGNIWASIPGALVMAAIVLIVSIHIKKKFEIVRTLNAGYSTAVDSPSDADAKEADVKVSGVDEKMSDNSEQKLQKDTVAAEPVPAVSSGSSAGYSNGVIHSSEEKAVPAHPDNRDATKMSSGASSMNGGNANA